MDPGQACLFSIVCRGARGGGDEQAEEEGRKEAGFGLRRRQKRGCPPHCLFILLLEWQGVSNGGALPMDLKLNFSKGLGEDRAVRKMLMAPFSVCLHFPFSGSLAGVAMASCEPWCCYGHLGPPRLNSE